MRSRWFPALAVAACALSFVAGRAFTGEPEDMQKAWEALAEKGPEHEALAKLAGEWTAAGKFYFTGQPTESTSTAKFTPVLGGRFLRQEVTGQFMGSPFEGIGYIGYSQATKKYVSVWIDNHGTGFMWGEGTMDPATKTLTFQDRMDGPGGQPFNTRDVMKLTSDKEMDWESYGNMGEGEKKMMEIHYTRK